MCHRNSSLEGFSLEQYRMPTGSCKFYLKQKNKENRKKEVVTFISSLQLVFDSKKLKTDSDDGLAIGNSIYSIRFERRDRFDKFGSKYWFQLEDAIDDCPEYLVHFPTFQRYRTTGPTTALSPSMLVATPTGFHVLGRFTIRSLLHYCTCR